MEFWAIIGFAVIVAIIIYYWFNPKIFKAFPKERKYPDNYAKHQDPSKYKKEYR